ncbi:MAG: UbiA family prenyltransferase [bacterium]|nr:UbiA family prenyltransferase [bacterium]
MLKKIYSAAKRVIILSRPSIWLYTGGVFILGTALALSNIENPSQFYTSHFIAGFVLYFFWFLIALNIAANSVNSYYDRKADAENPRKKKSWMIAEDYDKWPVFIGLTATAIFFIVISIVSFNLKISAMVAFLFIGTFLYSAYAFRVKNLLLLDTLLGAVVYVVPLLSGYIFVADNWPNFLWIIIAFLYFGATEFYAKIVDIESDRASGEKTSATILGKQKSLLVCVAAMIIVGFTLSFGARPIYGLVVVVPLSIFIFSLFIKDHDFLLKFYLKTMVIYNIWGFVVTSYFIIPLIAKIFNNLI